jgi:hypothetical protein
MYDDPIYARVINLILIFFLLICFRTNARHVVWGALRAQYFYCATLVETLMSSATADSKKSDKVEDSTTTKPQKKICCACPETKKSRDECIVKNG